MSEDGGGVVVDGGEWGGDMGGEVMNGGVNGVGVVVGFGSGMERGIRLIKGGGGDGREGGVVVKKFDGLRVDVVGGEVGERGKRGGNFVLGVVVEVGIGVGDG